MYLCRYDNGGMLIFQNYFSLYSHFSTPFYSISKPLTVQMNNTFLLLLERECDMTFRAHSTLFACPSVNDYYYSSTVIACIWYVVVNYFPLLRNILRKYERSLRYIMTCMWYPYRITLEKWLCVLIRKKFMWHLLIDRNSFFI